MFNNLKIRIKIAILSTVMAILMMVIGGIGILELSRANDKMAEMYNNNLHAIQYLEENRAHARAVLSEIFRLILLSGKEEEQKKVQDVIAERAEAFNVNYEKYKALGIFTEEEIKLQQAVELNLSQYREGRKKVIDLALQGKAEEAFKAFEIVEVPAEAFLQNLVDLTEYNVASAEALKKQNDENFVSSIKIFIGVIAAVLIFAAFATWTISKAIIVPIKVAIKHIGDVADYDLTNEIPEIYRTRKDEVGDLARIVHKIEENLKILVKSIGDTSEQVAASSEELTATSQQTAAAANEVARAINEIAKGATDQAESTTEGSERLVELGDLIEEDQHNIRLLTASAETVMKHVKEGLEVIAQLSKKNADSEEASKRVYHSIVKTDESSKKISEASSLITSIAKQTNLLSLNASIEAARAGEHGKGFAVVADEIRNLAAQSAEATRIIDEMVQSLQKDSKDAVEIMITVKKILEEQTHHVLNTEGKYREISSAIEASVEAVNTITASAATMESKKNEVLDTIQSLSAVAEENAAGTEEASASIEEQTSSMDEIANSSEGLSQLAQELYALISKFKL